MRKLLTYTVLALLPTVAVAAPYDTITQGILRPTGPVSVGTTDSIVLPKPLNGRHAFLLVYNPASNTCTPYFNFGAPANNGAGSIGIAPGSSMRFDSNFQDNEDLHGISATACSVTIKAY